MSAATVAGVVYDMPEAEYHAHPALSSTGARRMLQSPSIYRYWSQTPETPKPEFDIGTLTHSKVLGVGAQIAIYPEGLLASNGAASTTAAKEWAVEQREAGRIPVKADAAESVIRMTESVLAHREARRILENTEHRETSLFATDPETGVNIRARFDIYGDNECGDLKTAVDASPAGFTKAIWNHRYDVQDEHYLKARHLVVGDRPRFRFIAVEKTPPYLVGVYELDDQWQEIGDVWATHARKLFRMCTDADVWPGYGSDVHALIPPMGLIYEHQDRFAAEGMVI